MMTYRTLLRIKVVQLLYAYESKNEKMLSVSESELLKSIQKTTDLFYHILNLSVFITKYAAECIEAAKKKFRPTREELYPNTKFVNNLFVKQLLANNDFVEHVKSLNVSWDENPEVIKSIYSEIQQSSFYLDYMCSSENDFNEDKMLWRSIFEKIVSNNELLDEALEEQCIYWVDDLELALSFAVKTIKQMKEVAQEDVKSYIERYQSAIDNIQSQLDSKNGTNSRVEEMLMLEAMQNNQEKLDAWKALLKEETLEQQVVEASSSNLTNETQPKIELPNEVTDVLSAKMCKEDDINFAKELFADVISNKNDYRDLISRLSQHWDPDRIAFMDILIMLIAISEMVKFPTIPVNVTINEYIEIAKIYSTEKSHSFINGILDKAVVVLKTENKMLKVECLKS